ncbi:MAG: thioredoxin domain-containing protein [Candidatus Acidoferrales bacterium]
MSRISSFVLLVALATGIGWAARQSSPAANDAATVEVDSAWVATHLLNLRRILNLPGSIRLDFREKGEGSVPGYHLLLFDLRSGEERRTIQLYVSQDGRSVFYERLYDVEDPFQRFRDAIRLEEEPTRGPDDALVTIVEYSDYTCGYCRQFFHTLEEPLFERYGGQVRLVYKHFPLTGARAWAEDAAIASACAYRQGNDRFWALHGKLFQAATRLREGKSLLLELARQAGLDLPAFRQCLEQQDALIDIAQDVEEGERLGVDGTPSFFINGRPIPGLLPPEHFFHIVDEELAAARR